MASPKALLAIADPTYRRFALDLNSRWKTLSRKISSDVADRPELYSLIYLPNPVIVPGGRFRYEGSGSHSFEFCNKFSIQISNQADL